MSDTLFSLSPAELPYIVGAAVLAWPAWKAAKGLVRLGKFLGTMPAKTGGFLGLITSLGVTPPVAVSLFEGGSLGGAIGVGLVGVTMTLGSLRLLFPRNPDDLMDVLRIGFTADQLKKYGNAAQTYASEGPTAGRILCKISESMRKFHEGKPDRPSV